MTPFYDHDGIVIYHADCREVALPLCDMLLTDPPYGIAYVTAHRLRGDPLRVPVRGDGDLTVFASAWPRMLAALRDDRHWYVFASPRRLGAMCDIVGPVKHTLAWDKGDAGTVGDLECGFGEAWEAILYGMKGRRPLNGKRPRTIVRQTWSATRDPLHPTVKPIPLLERFVSWSSRPGELVLDPFMGSGTTLVAAKNLGRRAVGIEIEERYCEAAAERLAQEVLPL